MLMLATLLINNKTLKNDLLPGSFRESRQLQSPSASTRTSLPLSLSTLCFILKIAKTMDKIKFRGKWGFYSCCRYTYRLVKHQCYQFHFMNFSTWLRNKNNGSTRRIKKHTLYFPNLKWFRSERFCTFLYPAKIKKSSSVIDGDKVRQITSF